MEEERMSDDYSAATGCKFYSDCLTCPRDLSDCPAENDGYSRKVKLLERAAGVKKMKDGGLSNTVIAEKIGKSTRTVQRALVKLESCVFCHRTFKNVKAVTIHRYQCNKNPDCIKFNHGQRVKEYKKKLINDAPGHKLMTPEVMADYFLPKMSEEKKREQLKHKPISQKCDIATEELANARQIILVIPDGWDAETVTISYRRANQ